MFENLKSAKLNLENYVSIFRNKQTKKFKKQTLSLLKKKSGVIIYARKKKGGKRRRIR